MCIFLKKHIFDYGSKISEVKVSEKWGYSSPEAEFYKLNLHLTTVKCLYFDTFCIQRCCFLNIKYPSSCE